MRNSTFVLSGLLPVAVLLLVLGTQNTEAQLCPFCTCKPLYKPVCGWRPETKEELTFSSLCVLRCNNQCIEEPFSFKHRGVCAEKKSTGKSVKEENETFARYERPSLPDDLKVAVQ